MSATTVTCLGARVYCRALAKTPRGKVSGPWLDCGEVSEWLGQEQGPERPINRGLMNGLKLCLVLACTGQAHTSVLITLL